MPQSCIYHAQIMHHRFRPVRHRFTYRVFSLLLDLDDIPTMARRVRVLSHNRFNLFAFHDCDHGYRDGRGVRAWVEDQLRAHGVLCNAAKIYVLCFPRILGYVFNPVSIYWCHDAGGVLRAIVYEVKNTFGAQHAYVLPVRPDATGGTVRQRAAKAFYVSPFLEMETQYEFRVAAPEDRLSVTIHEDDAAGPLLVATHRGARQALTTAALLRAFFQFPLMTLKVIGGIHWEALQLWRKGVRLVAQPDADERVTR